MSILAYITDFFFQAKVEETAKQAEVPIRIVSTQSDFEEALGRNPLLVIVDLAAQGVDVVSLIGQVKGRVPVVAFGSHVDSGVLKRAAEAGARSLPRSKFSRMLPEIVIEANSRRQSSAQVIHPQSSKS